MSTARTDPVEVGGREPRMCPVSTLHGRGSVSVFHCVCVSVSRDSDANSSPLPVKNNNRT